MTKRSSSTVVAPRARTDGLIVRKLDGEVLVYNRDNDRACCLNAFAAEVWERCDGEATPAAIAQAVELTRSAPVDERAVWLALDQLNRSGLLEETMIMPATVLEGTNRRNVLRVLGFGGAALVPAVTSIMVPPAAAQGSPRPNGSPCASGADCISGFCNAGICSPGR